MTELLTPEAVGGVMTALVGGLLWWAKAWFKRNGGLLREAYTIRTELRTENKELRKELDSAHAKHRRELRTLSAALLSEQRRALLMEARLRQLGQDCSAFQIHLPATTVKVLEEPKEAEYVDPEDESPSRE